MKQKQKRSVFPFSIYLVMNTFDDDGGMKEVGTGDYLVDKTTSHEWA